MAAVTIQTILQDEADLTVATQAYADASGKVTTARAAIAAAEAALASAVQVQGAALTGIKIAQQKLNADIAAFEQLLSVVGIAVKPDVPTVHPV